MNKAEQSRLVAWRLRILRHAGEEGWQVARLYLRQNYLFGPGRIANYSRRFHDLVWPWPPCAGWTTRSFREVVYAELSKNALEQEPARCERSSRGQLPFLPALVRSFLFVAQKSICALIFAKRASSTDCGLPHVAP